MAVFMMGLVKERLSFIQKISALLAACGVAHELWHTQVFMDKLVGLYGFIHFII